MGSVEPLEAECARLRARVDELESLMGMVAALAGKAGLAADDRKPVRALTRALRDKAADDRLLTRPEAADTLRVSIRYLDAVTANGQLRHVRLGSRVLYRPADVAKYADAQVLPRKEWLREQRPGRR